MSDIGLWEGWNPPKDKCDTCKGMIKLRGWKSGGKYVHAYTGKAQGLQPVKHVATLNGLESPPAPETPGA